ncbi:MAG TPA: signal peptidase I [Terriglobia bacterium]|nr:signal peptidase I [Terriglobia bacterium]
MESSETLNATEQQPQPPGEQVPASSHRAARRDGLWETVRSLLIVLIGVFCIRTFVAEATVIPTGSMENTILIGDHVFLNKLLYGPQLPYTDVRFPRIAPIHRGDIVAFHYPVNPSQMFVKRVIGVGGDVIRIADKKVYVNGELQKEPYARFQAGAVLPLCVNFPPPVREIKDMPAVWGLNPKWAREMPDYVHKDGLHVPTGHLFVMGDNRDDSLDSRFWGFVPVQNVVGEPLFVYWSYNAPSTEWLDDSLRDRLKFDASILWNFFAKTRWSRMGKIF